jgi:parvulin-like peptidyl-prolyl isomerase
MTRPFLVGALGVLVWTGIASSAAVIDQIAAVVGKYAIKTSDVDRDLRVTQFLNGDAPDLSLPQRRKALQRLIDQELIRNDLAQAGNTSHLSGEATDILAQLRKDRFKGSQEALSAELRRRGLTPAQVSDQLQWQLVVLQYIDQRFRPGVLVSEDEMNAYYAEHKAELMRQYPGNTTTESMLPRIREVLEGERINRNFEEWLQEVRRTAHIEYKLDELK